MTDWITIGVVSGVVLFFVAIMYKALKEPLDLLFGWFRKMWFYFIEGMHKSSSEIKETIKYE